MVTGGGRAAAARFSALSIRGIIPVGPTRRCFVAASTASRRTLFQGRDDIFEKNCTRIPVLSNRGQSIFSARRLSTASSVSLEYSHPLDPLSANEITAVSSAIRSHVGVSLSDDPGLEKLRFIAVSLKEPAKSKLVAVLEKKAPSSSLARQAEVVTLNPVTGLASEYDLELSMTTAGTITAEIVMSRVLAAGNQPMFTPEDCDLAEAIVKNSAAVAAALKERYGITDISRVACDPWSVNLACDEDVALNTWRSKAEGSDVPGRLVQTFLYHRQYGEGMEDNQYAHPIDILPLVDLNARKVVDIGGLDRPAPTIPTASVNYHRNLVKTNSYLQTMWRKETLTALDVIQVSP
jgi:primary-amine oxidase